VRVQTVLVPAAGLLMLFALITGIVRLMALEGMLGQPPLVRTFPLHGEVMVFGFLAVLIVTERYLGSLTFRLNPAVHSMPFLVGAGAVLKLLGRLTGADPLHAVGTILLALGVVIYIYLLLAVSRQSAQALPFCFMLLAAILLLLGDLLTLRSSPVGRMNLSLILLGFPILTIIGERVELSRYISPRLLSRMRWGLAACAVAFLLLLIAENPVPAGVWAVLLGLAVLPLLSSESSLVRAAGASPERLHRYLGKHLVVAYFWFFLGLALTMAWAVGGSGPALFDASLHALAVGFIGTMILAHAPLVVPAILHLNVAHEGLSFVPLALLTAGNLLRVGGQVLKAVLPLESLIGASGLLILAALIAFVWMMGRSLRPA